MGQTSIVIDFRRPHNPNRIANIDEVTGSARRKMSRPRSLECLISNQGRSFTMFSHSSFRRLALSLAMFAIVALSSAALAKADQVVINVPNPGLSGTPGPYATVTYTLNGSGGIDVSVQMAAGFAAFGDGNGNNGIFGFNVVGSTAGLAVTNLSPNTLTANLGGGNMDGFGNFDVTLSCCNASNAI